MNFSLKKLAIPAILLMSIAATGYGFFRLTVFGDTPGPTTSAPRQWPAKTQIARADKVPTVLVFAHPGCTCTDATLTELTEATKNHNAAIRIFFIRQNHDTRWLRPQLWAKAQAIPNATIAWDEDATEANRFHAETSGQILLYSPKGDLLFEGGITGSRGHVGDNYGLNELTAALNNHHTENRPAVFGCSLIHFTSPPQ